MGFTIGGIREMRSGTRRRGRGTGATAVAEYTGLWGWAVAPGARASAGACSCGDTACASPGAHPLDFAGEVPPGATLGAAADAWAEVPGASVLLPVGRTFDVLDVPEAAGRHALVRMERMGLPLGPVAVTPAGRAQFFVAPGAAAGLPGLLYRMGWDDADLDLRALGPGAYVTAPPRTSGASARSAGCAPRSRTRPRLLRRRGCYWARSPTYAIA